MVGNRNNELPEGFKITELAPLPIEWDIVNLGRVVHVYDKQRIPLPECHLYELSQHYPSFRRKLCGRQFQVCAVCPKH